jgi:hypothetical protein
MRRNSQVIYQTTGRRTFGLGAKANSSLSWARECNKTALDITCNPDKTLIAADAFAKLVDIFDRILNLTGQFSRRLL